MVTFRKGVKSSFDPRTSEDERDGRVVREQNDLSKALVEWLGAIWR